MVSLLGSGEIAVRWMLTDGVSAPECERMFALLDRQERERADRFHFDVDRRDFVAAHALVRSMLTRYLEPDRSPSAWRFVSDAYGKPAVVGQPDERRFEFNLSHTRGMVAVAMGSDCQIGIDVERIDPTKAGDDIAREYFAPAEVHLLRQVPEEERTASFFRIWTLKEAYLKATGSGLNTPLDLFSFSFDPVALTFDPRIDDTPQRWRFAMLPASDHHALSIAVSDTLGPIRLDLGAVTQDSEAVLVL